MQPFIGLCHLAFRSKLIIMISSFIFLHVAAGAVAIISGFGSLIPRKGSKIHKLTGNIFYYSMVLMAGMATFLAIFDVHETINALIGLFTVYLVYSGRLAVKEVSRNSVALKLTVVVSGILTLAFYYVSYQALISGKAIVDGVYVEAFYVYAFLSTLAFFLDLKTIITGPLKGKQRIARHLWRMILGLFIASGSLFLGQPQVFPELLQNYLYVPVLVVVLSLLYWMVRVFIGKRFKMLA